MAAILSRPQCVTCENFRQMALAIEMMVVTPLSESLLKLDIEVSLSATALSFWGVDKMIASSWSMKNI